MPIFTCCSSSSVRPRAVIQPAQQKTQHYATTQNAIGSTAHKEAQLAEYAASLRSIQANKEPVRSIQAVVEPKKYWSNEINLSSAEAGFLANVTRDVCNVLYIMKRIKEDTSFPTKLFDTLKEGLKENMQVAEQLQCDKSLTTDSISALQCVHQLYSDPEKLIALSANPDAHFFCEPDNLKSSIIPFFNGCCYWIPFNTYLENLRAKQSTSIQYDDRRCLSSVSKYYAQKEILKNQLPILKEKLIEVKHKNTLDKTFITILEHAVRSMENCIHNMEQPQRAAIMEVIAPKARPTHHRELLHDKNCMDIAIGSRTVRNMSDKEIECVYQKLKEIPFEII